MTPQPATQPYFLPFPQLYGRQLIAIIPAYNEERYIEQAILDAKSYADIVIVVDDGSTDDTAEMAQLCGAHVISHESNRGRHAAQALGLVYARQYGADIIVAVNVGCSLESQAICKLVAPILASEADMVIGKAHCGVKNSIFSLKHHRDPGAPIQQLDFDLMACTADAAQRVRCANNGRSLEFEQPLGSDIQRPRVLALPVVHETPLPQKQLTFWQKLSPFHGLQFT